jgi:hypothetical protein
LEALITTNTIAFGQDKENSAWTVGFYLDNAKHRLRSAVEHYKALYNNGLDELLAMFRARGMHDIKVTQYEWEAAHSVLRAILAIIYPKAKLEVKQPSFPEDAWAGIFNNVKK